MNKKLSIFFAFFCATIVVTSYTACLKSKRLGLPKEVISVLNISGANKPQLNKFILNCMETNDSLLLDACYYILGNLNKNYSSFYSLKDSLNNRYKIEAESFSNLNEVIVYIDSIKNKRGYLEYKADSFSVDFESLDSKLLTDNLMTAFDTYYKNKAWLDYDFHTFKKYILPYRAANEIVEPFRFKLSELLKNEIDTKLSFEKNVYKINRKLNQLLSYDERFIKTMQRPTINEELNTGKANLENINVFKVKAFRSLGIAATMDYTPALSDTNGWLAWTTVISPIGKEIHLDVANGKLKYCINNYLPKVYRRLYESDSSSLFYVKSIKESSPPFMGHYNNKDVSDLYGHNYTYEIAKTNKDKYQYLAVYNDGKWKAVDWAPNDDTAVIFNNISDNIIYLPCKWEGKKCVATHYPFIIKDGRKILFKPKSGFKKQEIKYYSPNKTLQQNSLYKLYYWDNEWIEVENYKSLNNYIISNLPENTIYLIKDDNIFNDERIFVLENGKQIFY